MLKMSNGIPYGVSYPPATNGATFPPYNNSQINGPYNSVKNEHQNPNVNNWLPANSAMPNNYGSAQISNNYVPAQPPVKWQQQQTSPPQNRGFDTYQPQTQTVNVNHSGQPGMQRQLHHPVPPSSTAPQYNSYQTNQKIAPPPVPTANNYVAQPAPGNTVVNNYIAPPHLAAQQQANRYSENLNYQMSNLQLNQTYSQPNDKFSNFFGPESVNLMTEKDIKTKSYSQGSPRTSTDPKQQSSFSDVMRCTLTKVPESASLLQKSRLPLGVLIHPFKNDDEIPIIHDSPIVRCRSCRTYINPYVRLLEQHKWQCNLCQRINEMPEDFYYNHELRQFVDPSTKPELSCGSVEYIASVEYMVRPPQPAAYLFVFDCSCHATQLGYIPVFARAVLESLDEIPGDARTLIGFIAFDSKLHFFNLGEKQPVHLVLPDIQDVFLPAADNLLVNLKSKQSQVEEFLKEMLPVFPRDRPNETVVDNGSALGAALQAAYKVIAPYGGRVTLIQATLPNFGSNDGSVLTNREDPNSRNSSNTNVNNLTPLLNPGTDFYKKLALECSEHQIAIDLFNLSQSYSDLSTTGSVSKYCGGSIHYYGASNNPVSAMLGRFEEDMKHYLTRNIGFEAVMRMRCTRGLSIHTFHGNFFVRSTDLLALPNVNPDSGYAMQISIDEDLKDYNQVCFQSAILYTSSQGERRIRVHTLSLPTASVLPDVINGADQEAIVGLLAKMAVDRSLSSSISDAREALINAVVDILSTHRNITPSQITSGLSASYSTRLVPLLVLSLLKHQAFRIGISTKMDERVFAMERMKSLPLNELLVYIYPNLYPVHSEIDYENEAWPNPLQLSFANIERNGVYLLDTFDHLYLYICKSVHPQWLADVFGITQWSQIPDDSDLLPNAQTHNLPRPSPSALNPETRPIVPLPEMENQTSIGIRLFIDSLIENRPFKPQFHILREDSRLRYSFLQYMVDDRNESAFSYYEFLQHIQQQLKN